MKPLISFIAILLFSSFVFADNLCRDVFKLDINTKISINTQLVDTHTHLGLQIPPPNWSWWVTFRKVTEAFTLGEGYLGGVVTRLKLVDGTYKTIKRYRHRQNAYSDVEKMKYLQEYESELPFRVADYSAIKRTRKYVEIETLFGEAIDYSIERHSEKEKAHIVDQYNLAIKKMAQWARQKK